MKILQVQNQKMQNSNNRPINFGGFRSFVSAADPKDTKRFMAIAVRLTEEDFKQFHGLLKEFHNPKLDKDVLSIRAEVFAGDEHEDDYKVLINGHDLFDPHKDLMLMLKGKPSKTERFVNQLKTLLERITAEKKLDKPKKADEKKKMLQALSGENELKQDEIVTRKDSMTNILDLLHSIISNEGKLSI